MRRKRRARLRSILRKQRLQVLATWLTFIAIWCGAGWLLLTGFSFVIDMILTQIAWSDLTP